MNRTRRFLSVLLALGGALALSAADQPAKPADPKAAETAKPDAKPVNPEVVVLPTVQVTSQRIKQIDKEIDKLDQLIAREKKQARSSGLDKTLNNKKLSTAAAIFGGNSAEHLAAMAASRVSIMEAERSVLEDMKRPATPEDLKALETELDQLKVTARDLDNINRDGPSVRP